MIKARHHIVIYPFFTWLGNFMIKNHFSKVHLNGHFHDNGNAVFVVANHISWWDGFWIQYLNQKVIHRLINFMMVEKQLIKYWYFRYTGGYSVNPGSKNVLESLNYTIQLLNNPQNMVLMFPQGKIYSLYQSDIHFEKGINFILCKCKPAVQVLFVANFIDYLNNKKPQLFIYYKSYSLEDIKNSNIENEYNLFYQECMLAQKSLTV